jgi:hypothetical protein
MLTMAPARRETISRSTSWLRMKGAWKFTSQERIHLFTGKSFTGMK